MITFHSEFEYSNADSEGEYFQSLLKVSSNSKF